MLSHLEPSLGSVRSQTCQVQRLFITSTHFTRNCFSGPASRACSLSSSKAVSCITAVGLLCLLPSLTFHLPGSPCLLNSAFTFSYGVCLPFQSFVLYGGSAVLTSSDTCGTASGAVLEVHSAVTEASFGNFTCVLICRKLPLGKSLK